MIAREGTCLREDEHSLQRCRKAMQRIGVGGIETSVYAIKDVDGLTG